MDIDLFIAIRWDYLSSGRNLSSRMIGDLLRFLLCSLLSIIHPMSNAQVFGAKAGFSAHVVSCRAVITTLPLYFKRAPCLPFPTFNNSQNQL